MTEQLEVIEKDELDSVYPVHYHGFIKFYDSAEVVVTKTTRDMVNQYGEDFELLGIG